MSQGTVNQINVINPLPAGAGGTGTTTSTGTGNIVLSNSPTITTPLISGITSGVAVAPGFSGEVISSVVTAGFALTDGQSFDITSMVVTTGNWLIFGNAVQVNGTSEATFQTWINTVPATIIDLPFVGSYYQNGVASFSTISTNPIMRRFRVSQNTRFYLSCVASTLTGTFNVLGSLYALRIS